MVYLYMTKEALQRFVIQERFPKLVSEINKRIKAAAIAGKGYCLLTKSVRNLSDKDFKDVISYCESLGYYAYYEFKIIGERKREPIFNHSEKRLYISWDGSYSNWDLYTSVPELY